MPAAQQDGPGAPDRRGTRLIDARASASPRRRWRLGSLALAALGRTWLACVPAVAQPAQPAPALHLSYALYSHGLHIMDVEADLTLTDNSYRISLHDRTTGLVGLLVRSDVTSIADGRFDGTQARPYGFSSSGRSRGVRRVVRIAYPGGDPQVLELAPIDADRDPVAAPAAARSIDSLSAVVSLVRSVARTGRCDGETRLFDGLRLSTLQARTIGEQTLPVDERSPFAGPALRCDVVGRQIGGFLHDADEAQKRRPQQGSAWLAAPFPGAPPLPVRVVFEPPRFGNATLFLTRAAPAP